MYMSYVLDFKAEQKDAGRHELGYHFISYSVVIVNVIIESSIIPLSHGCHGGCCEVLSPLVRIMGDVWGAEVSFIEHFLDWISLQLRICKKRRNE